VRILLSKYIFMQSRKVFIFFTLKRGKNTAKRKTIISPRYYSKIKILVKYYIQLSF